MLSLPVPVLAAGGVLGGLLLVAPATSNLVSPGLAVPTAPASYPARTPVHAAAHLVGSPARLGAARPVPITDPQTEGATSRTAPPGRTPPAPAPAASWTWPLQVAPRVLRAFEPPAQRWLPGHRGVDLAAVPGDAVVAAGAGTVTFAGPLAGRGVVTVTHGSLRTTYEPVTASVHVGDAVAAGERIGTLAAGAGHCGGYPGCLHWGLLRGSVYLDPLSVLGVNHPILLPIPSTRE